MKEQQEDVLHHRERELNALKGALKEEVETHDKEMTILKDEYEHELHKLIKDVEMTIEVTTSSTLFPRRRSLPLFVRLHSLFCHSSRRQEQRAAGSGEDSGGGGERLG